MLLKQALTLLRKLLKQPPVWQEQSALQLASQLNHQHLQSL
jgi:hypothetical protein